MQGVVTGPSDRSRWLLLVIGVACLLGLLGMALLIDGTHRLDDLAHEGGEPRHRDEEGLTRFNDYSSTMLFMSLLALSAGYMLSFNWISIVGIAGGWNFFFYVCMVLDQERHVLRNVGHDEERKEKYLRESLAGASLQIIAALFVAVCYIPSRLRKIQREPFSMFQLAGSITAWLLNFVGIIVVLVFLDRQYDDESTRDAYPSLSVSIVQNHNVRAFVASCLAMVAATYASDRLRVVALFLTFYHFCDMIADELYESRMEVWYDEAKSYVNDKRMWHAANILQIISLGFHFGIILLLKDEPAEEAAAKADPLLPPGEEAHAPYV